MLTKQERRDFATMIYDAIRARDRDRTTALVAAAIAANESGWGQGFADDRFNIVHNYFGITPSGAYPFRLEWPKLREFTDVSANCKSFLYTLEESRLAGYVASRLHTLASPGWADDFFRQWCHLDKDYPAKFAQLFEEVKRLIPEPVDSDSMGWADKKEDGDND